MFSASELACFRETADASMMDSCKIGTEIPPTFGEDPGDMSFAWSDEVPCGFSPRTGGEVQDGTQAPLYAATLRLPFDSTIDGIDRVKLTKRYGEAFGTEIDFVVDGKPVVGLSCLTLNLKLITGNSSL